MTDQVDLSRVWASSGGSTNPGTSKYVTGWVVEIPTYQNFNYVLKGLDTNLLALAEGGMFDWQDNISYKVSSKVRRSGSVFTCITSHLNQDPDLDSTGSYWTKGGCYGGDHAGLTTSQGVVINTIKSKSDNTWSASEITLMNNNTMVAFNCSGLYNNWLLGNSKGDMVIIDVDQVVLPDGRLIAVGDSKVYKIYHEGNKPTLDDIDGILTANPNDNKFYGRYNNNWQEIKTANGGTTDTGTSTDSYVTPKAMEDSSYVKEVYVDERTFASGTRLPFYQNAPPTGWTNLNVNDHMLRAVSTGGGVNGGSDSPVNWSHEHTTQGHKLSIGELPNHDHITGVPENNSNQYYYNLVSGLAPKKGFGDSSAADKTASPTTSFTGGNGTHYHGNTESKLFTPKYSNLIICSKN